MNPFVPALCASALLFAQAPPVDTSAKAVISAASAYVESYNTKLQNVLADELATQRVDRNGPVQVWGRTTKADLFITFLPADSVWIAVRDVREVDGAVVDDPNNIRVLMERTPLTRLGAVIAQKNSQFNIGNISRTFNEPTLALLVMTSKHKDRFKFDVSSGAPAKDGTLRATIAFKEKDRPTLISGSNGAPAFTSGILLVDAASGRVEFTRLELKLGSVTAKIETTYGENTKLELWVPSEMRETYGQTAKNYEQTIRCVSMYTNYRKFETKAIIK